MTFALVAGLGVGVGILMTVRGFVPPTPPLTRALRQLDGSGTKGSHPRVVSVLGAGSARTRRALRVAGTTIERHAASKALTAAAFGGFAVAAGLVAAAGGVEPPWPAVTLLAVAGGVVGFVVPDATLHGEARRRRRELRDAIAAYLDLAVTVMAGGGGVETALHDAAEVGTGWAFDELRQALEVSRLAGEAPWDGFRRLGEELGSEELVELAAGATLAGEHGARIRSSLAARAASLREHRLAEVEAEAQSATERMAVPVVLMLFGFVVFVGYPAVQRVLVGL